MQTQRTSSRTQTKQDQIRAAAQELFLADGVAGTSMDAVAAQARVSKQTVYAHFHSKEALLRDVLETLVTRRAGNWQAALRHAPTPRTHEELTEQLQALALQITETLMDPEYLGTARVIITECPRNPELGELFSQAVAGPVLEVVGEVIAKGASAGVIDVDAPEAAARLLVGGLLTYVLLDGLLRPTDMRRPDPGDLNAMVRLLVGRVAG